MNFRDRHLVQFADDSLQKWAKQKWEDSDFMNSTEEEQWNKITKMFDAIGIDIESVFNHIESLLGVKVRYK